MAKVVSEVPPERQLNARVRAAFVMKGTTLHAWCGENGVDPAHAYKALIGQWRGPAGHALVARIKAAAGVQDT